MCRITLRVRPPISGLKSFVFHWNAAPSFEPGLLPGLVSVIICVIPRAEVLSSATAMTFSAPYFMYFVISIPNGDTPAS